MVTSSLNAMRTRYQRKAQLPCAKYSVAATLLGKLLIRNTKHRCVAQLLKSLQLMGNIYLDLWCSLRFDAAGPAGVEDSTHVTLAAYDCLTVISRFKEQGFGFLTGVLPALGKQIDAYLLRSFSKTRLKPLVKEATGQSHFMWELLDRLETDDESTGVWTPGDVAAVKAVRQLLFVFYKLEVPYADGVEASLLRSFASTDAALPLRYAQERQPQQWDSTCISNYETYASLFNTTWQEAFSHQAPDGAWIVRYLVGRVLGQVDPRSMRGRHGPGAVATGERGAQKRLFSRFYDTVARWECFDTLYHYNLSQTELTLGAEGIRGYQEVPYGTAKVVLVPKDSRGPRIISCEPLELQWCQQGLMTLMVERMESFWLTRGHVNFTDQTVNRQLALDASRDGKRATLDMKEASDRVSVAHIDLYMPHTWQEALMATRSYRTKLPTGEEIALRKFAPMGSAVCFPVEALLFWAICTAAVYSKRMGSRTAVKRVHIPTLRDAASTIYVYGDDIICNTEDRDVIEQALTANHFVVNQSKSCSTGLFRESCGLDAYDGVEVQPLRVKRRLDIALQSPGFLMSTVAVSNGFWRRGDYFAADTTEAWACAHHAVPYLEDSDPERIAFQRPFGYSGHGCKPRLRYNRKLQRREMLGWAVKPVEQRCPTDYPELLRWHTKAVRESDSAPILSERKTEAGIHALPRRVTLQRGWMPVH